MSHKFARQVWWYRDTLWAAVEVQQPDRPYDIALEVALEDNYPWRNLYLMAIWEEPGGYRQSSRTQLIFQDETGKWYASSRRFRTFLGRGIRFGSPGRYRLGLLPYVRPDSVPGIRNLTLRLYARE